MFKKVISVLAALSVALSTATAAFAKSSFSDVISPDYDWAANDIEEMTTLGIIKGYTDGTFRPAITIRKIEALLLFARAAGYSNADYEPFVNYAISLYTPVLEKYDLGTTYNRYKDEVSFLLYKGILNQSELDTYLKSAGSGLKRYEAAILITKLMGAEESVRQNAAAVFDYSDFAQIPAAARPYVEYVTNKGYMKGLENNTFGPNEDVTRVQITIILKRMLDALNYTTTTGVVRAVDTATNTVTVYDEANDKADNYTITSGVTVIKDGVRSALANVVNGSEALILYSGNELVGFEVLSPEGATSPGNGSANNQQGNNTQQNNQQQNNQNNQNNNDNTNDVVPANEEVKGKLANIIAGSNSTEFSVNTSSETRIFTLPSNSDAEITLDGKNVKFSALSAGNDVTIAVEKGEIVEIEAFSGVKTVSGTVRDIDSEDLSISVRLSSGNASYDVSSDVKVTRNGAASNLASVAEGDSVTLTLLNSVVTDIAAQSTDTSATGTISSISIGSSPSLGIKTANGDEVVYPISDKAKITHGGKTVTLYDLRVGSNVTVEIEGGVITSITSTVSQSSYQKTGVITSVSSSSPYVTVSIDGKSERIYAATKSNGAITAVVVNSATGKTVSFTSLEKGDLITAIGAYDEDDRFVAATVVLIPPLN